MGGCCAALHPEEVMSAEIKQYLDPSTLTDATVPWYGDMPDVAMALPGSTDPENKDLETTAVWPWRIFLGAEDDPNRAKVYKWEQVDDLAGLTKLWAGSYNGTLYLHAGEEAPAAAEDDSSDMAGAPVGDSLSVWRNGQPIQPFSALAQDVRDQMLKNESGQWRRLVWEPVGLFDVALGKNLQGYNFERFTLWMVVEHPFIAFYTTKAEYTGETQQDGAPARWPFSYYRSVARVNDMEQNYYEECIRKITWMIEEGKLEEADHLLKEELSMPYIPAFALDACFNYAVPKKNEERIQRATQGNRRAELRP